MPEDVKAALKASLRVVESEERPQPEQEHKENNVVDLALARIKGGDVCCKEVTPIQLLQLAIEECQNVPNVTRCYITLIQEEPDGPTSTINFRSNLTRLEEVAYRQLGASEAIDSWRN